MQKNPIQKMNQYQNTNNLNKKIIYTNISKKDKFFYLMLVLGLLALNLSFSVLVRILNLYFVPNTRPFGVSFGPLVSLLILAFISWSLDVLEFFEKYTLASILIAGGAWSNFVERLFFGAVADYIPFVLSTINIADIQIWIGLIILNYKIWFEKKPS